jgi:hypothetical protein
MSRTRQLIEAEDSRSAWQAIHRRSFDQWMAKNFKSQGTVYASFSREFKVDPFLGLKGSFFFYPEYERLFCCNLWRYSGQVVVGYSKVSIPEKVSQAQTAALQNAVKHIEYIAPHAPPEMGREMGQEWLIESIERAFQELETHL